MVGNRGKKPRIAAAEEADPVENDPLLSAVVKLQRIQDELEKVNEEANEEILEIQQEYVNKRKPVYVRRNKIISEIPNFWLTSFLYHPTIEDLLTEQDKKMLEYLSSVNVEDFKDATKGYCITFNFKSNPFFKNKKLTRTIKFLDDGNLRSVGSTIYWKVGKGLADEKKRDKRQFPNDSFFSWLSSSKEDNKEVEHDLVAEIIREEIWPNPIGPLDIPADDFSDEDEEEETEEEDTDEDDEDEDEDRQ